MIAQQRDVAAIGAKHNVESIADKRNRTDKTIERDIGEHTPNQQAGYAEGACSLTIYKDMIIVTTSPMPGISPITASIPNRMLVPGMRIAVSSSVAGRKPRRGFDTPELGWKNP